MRASSTAEYPRSASKRPVNGSVPAGTAWKGGLDCQKPRESSSTHTRQSRCQSGHQMDSCCKASRNKLQLCSSKKHHGIFVPHPPEPEASFQPLPSLPRSRSRLLLPAPLRAPSRTMKRRGKAQFPFFYSRPSAAPALPPFPGSAEPGAEIPAGILSPLIPVTSQIPASPRAKPFPKRLWDVWGAPSRLPGRWGGDRGTSAHIPGLVSSGTGRTMPHCAARRGK